MLSCRLFQNRCYFDLYQVPDSLQHLEPLTGSKKHIAVKKVYNDQPIPAKLNRLQAKLIQGAQGNVWNEYLPIWHLAMDRSLPRMRALSEVLWSPKAARNWSSFKVRLTKMLKLHDDMDYHSSIHWKTSE